MILVQKLICFSPRSQNSVIISCIKVELLQANCQDLYLLSGINVMWFEPIRQWGWTLVRILSVTCNRIQCTSFLLATIQPSFSFIIGAAFCTTAECIFFLLARNWLFLKYLLRKWYSWFMSTAKTGKYIVVKLTNKFSTLQYFQL